MSESDQLEPIEGSPDQILLKRGFTVHRLREPQPAINAPAQDSVPGTGSGDT